MFDKDLMEKGGDVEVFSSLPPSGAFHNRVESVLSKYKRGIRGIAQNAVGSAPDGFFLEFPQLLKWGKMVKPARPAVPELLQLGAKSGVSQSAGWDRWVVIFPSDLRGTRFAMEM